MKRLKWIIPLVTALTLLCACFLWNRGETHIPEDEYIVLRVLTEATTVDGMKSQINEMISLFEAEYENVNLILETLPAKNPQRRKALSEVYVAIAKGEGPDVYLLPAGSSVAVAHSAYQTSLQTPLFTDVANSMRRGTFADISAYYDADTALGKEELQTGVMNAGVVGDARYVLPLRYSIPVIYADRAALAEADIDEEQLHKNVLFYMNTVLESGSTDLARSAVTARLHHSYFFNLLPEVIDYDTMELRIGVQDIQSYLLGLNALWNQSGQISDDSPAPHMGAYISAGESWAANGSAMVPGGLESAPDAAAIARVEDVDLSMIPLCAVDGALVADVTWYGAVGADCVHPETAYEFLRMFLSEDAQWERNRPRSSGGITSGLIGSGCPVRSVGCAEALWDNLRFQLDFYIGQEGNGWEDRTAALKAVELTDSDLEILSVPVDRALFSVPAESAAGLSAGVVLSYVIEQGTFESNRIISILRWYVEQLK